jgi:glycosyltransferase involved in cell wall biosynthesis
MRMASRKELGLPDDAVIIALVARVDPMKDHATFLEAARQTTQARRNARFVLIGKDTEQLAEEVAAKGLREVVRLLGHRKDVERLLPGVDLLCLSSAFGEGFPNVIGEAMACGIPCVATDVGDVRSIIDDTGLVVPSCDPSALAKALINLIDQGSNGRERLGRAARERIEKTYALSKIVDQYMALYSALVAKEKQV